MRKRAGINTSVLDKIEKNETASMDTPARIAAAMDRGLDDIVEVNTDIEKGGKE